MAVFRRRDQVVVFRVTTEEHAQLQKACETSGSRNLSDFVRMELLSRVQSRIAARTNLAGLERRLSHLEANYLERTKCVQTGTEPDADGSNEIG